MQQVRVKYHHEDGTWWADSPDVPGYVAAGDTQDEVRDQVREGLAFFLEDDVDILETLPQLPDGVRLVALEGSVASASSLGGEVTTWTRTALWKLSKADVVKWPIGADWTPIGRRPALPA